MPLDASVVHSKISGSPRQQLVLSPALPEIIVDGNVGGAWFCLLALRSSRCHRPTARQPPDRAAPVR